MQSLISALRDRASEVRQAAVYFLGRLGDPACVEALARTLEDNDSDVRAAAADSLIELGDTRGMEAGLASVERILRMLDDPNEEDPNLTVAVEIFGTYRYGVELLNYGVKEHPDEEVRRLAALVLSCTTSPLVWAAKPKGDEAFCLKCRTKQKIKNPAPVVLKSGLCTRGTCPKCGTKVYRYR